MHTTNYTRFEPWQLRPLKLSNGVEVKIEKTPDNPFWTIVFDTVETPESLLGNWTDRSSALSALKEHLRSVSLTIEEEVELANEVDNVFYQKFI